MGIQITYRALQDCKANFAFDCTLNPPWGLHGGESGAPSKGVITRLDDSTMEVFKATEVPIHTGDRVTFMTAGGGGFGKAELRDRASVKADVSAGVVSERGAENIYKLTPEE